MTVPHTEVMLDALDRLRGTGAEYNGFLANHGPMAAEAMIRLGWPDDVPGWVDRYLPRLSAEPPLGKEVTEANWHDNLGDLRRLGDWNRFFTTAAAETDWRTLLATWWPRLLPGAAASATHGLIRTAHAVRALALAGADPDPLLTVELGRGLAFWATRYQPVPGSPSLTGALAPVQAIAALPRLSQDVPSAGPGIMGRLYALVALRDLPDALDALGTPEDCHAALDRLIAAAARVLAARDDAPIAFCHAVTAPAAMHMVLDELPAELHRPSVAVSWQVIGAIVAAFGSPRLDAEGTSPEADPTSLLADLPVRAVEHGDEHVIKLTEATLRQYARTGDTALLVAADRFRGRLPALRGR
jgi:Questin oxidase-like